MSDDDVGSVTRWIDELKAGDPQAARELWDRYFARLVSLARARLRRAAHRGSADADEEDAALSAFDSFCRGVSEGRFARLNDRDDLWQLLVVLTSRKAIDHAKRQRALKRGGDRMRAEPHRHQDSVIDVLEGLPGPEPTPEFAAMVAEEYTRLLEILDDETLRIVATRRLDGYTSEEIARELGCAVRTVANKLKIIRLKWEQAHGPRRRNHER
jgi:DNA-directed RNA polymerase specialized sigma24 family protein